MFAASKTASVSGGYQISRSLRFNSADSAYLNRTPASASNQKTWTFSAWVKRASISTTEIMLFGKADTYISINSNSLTANFNNGGSNYFMQATAVLRDPSAWYHIIIVLDTTQATAANRASMYVNGVQTTAFQTSTYTNMSQNYDAAVNSAAAHAIGRYSGTTPSNYFDGYVTEVNFIDGQALTPSSFGETNAQTGVWQPKAYSGSYGTNGFYLNFSDNSNTTAATLGKDYSGNGNNWTPNNFSVTAGAGNDSLVDSPTSYGTDTGVGGTVRGNYATLNPLYIDGGSASTFSNGNLEVNTTGRKIRSTIAIPEGSKIYAEFYATSIPNFTFIGVTNGSDEPNMASGNYGFSEYAVNDIIGIAVDTTANTIAFYKNGTLFAARTTTIIAGTTYFYVVYGQAATSFVANFGQRPFAYTAPSGFKALCTQNLPTPTIGATTATQAGKYFNPVIYTGNGGTQSVTGVGFQPDFVWLKNRTNANAHALEDVIRGAGYTLASSETSAEINYSSYFTAFTSDGFNMALGGGTFNGSGSNYVAWNWKANGSGSTNTSGSITSTVSANTTSGFSIVTYTGTGANATVGHGLGVAPSMIICKARTGTSVGAWQTYHSALGATKTLFLNLTDAAYTNSLYWNNTAPTSSVFSLGGNTDGNGSGYTMVAYCFAEVAGYSKFGSYTGNGSADGPFLFTGFKPAFVLIKSSNFSASWRLWDAKRNTYNVVNSALFPNLSNAEVSTADYAIDFLSNGIKIRSADDGENQSGSTFIYAAFAENPFKYSLAR